MVGLGHGPQRLNERFAQRSGEGTACPFRRLDQLRSSGHAAAPPSPEMKSRRRRKMLIWPSLAGQWIKPEGAGRQAIGQAIGDRGPTDPARRMGPALGQRRPLARSPEPVPLAHCLATARMIGCNSITHNPAVLHPGSASHTHHRQFPEAGAPSNSRPARPKRPPDPRAGFQIGVPALFTALAETRPAGRRSA